MCMCLCEQYWILKLNFQVFNEKSKIKSEMKMEMLSAMLISYVLNVKYCTFTEPEKRSFINKIWVLGQSRCAAYWFIGTAFYFMYACVPHYIYYECVGEKLRFVFVNF